MVSKIALIFCLLLLVGVLNVDAQRDGRRRSGRRKPTTELPPPVEEPESEKNPQKIDAEPEAVAKPSSAQPAEPETNTSPSDKESGNNNHGGPPFIVPRGTRKPRPMHVRNQGEPRPRPTLPTFARKNSGRRTKVDPSVKKNVDESAATSSTSTTTAKPSRNSSRRRNNSPQASERGPATEKASHSEDAEVPTEAPAKKRFGGGARRPSRGSRRQTPAPEEA